MLLKFIYWKGDVVMISIEDLYKIGSEEFSEWTMYKQNSKWSYYFFNVSAFIFIVFIILSMFSDIMLLVLLSFILLLFSAFLLSKNFKKNAFGTNGRDKFYDINLALYQFKKTAVINYLKGKDINLSEIPYKKLIEALEAHSDKSRKTLIDIGIILLFLVPVWNWYVKSSIDTEVHISEILLTMSIILSIIFFLQKFLIYPIYRMLDYKSRVFSELTLIFKEMEYEYADVAKNTENED